MELLQGLEAMLANSDIGTIAGTPTSHYLMNDPHFEFQTSKKKSQPKQNPAPKKFVA